MKRKDHACVGKGRGGEGRTRREEAQGNQEYDRHRSEKIGESKVKLVRHARYTDHSSGEATLLWLTYPILTHIRFAYRGGTL